MTLPLARDLAGHGIRVMTISPGGFDTPMNGLNKYPREVMDSLMKRMTLFPPRFGHPEEYASTVMWILQCSYVNGETIRLTGGSRLPPSL
jgi:NAD(P)-dependent dehydrogenase (short-subunit alcohol dehydrogenase family)